MIASRYFEVMLGRCKFLYRLGTETPIGYFKLTSTTTDEKSVYDDLWRFSQRSPLLAVHATTSVTARRLLVEGMVFLFQALKSAEDDVLLDVHCRVDILCSSGEAFTHSVLFHHKFSRFSYDNRPSPL